MPELADLAAVALDRQRAVGEHLAREPRCTTADGTWSRWAAHRDLLVTEREFAAQAFIEHPEYKAWHRQVWRDDVSAQMRAMSVWAPVARQVVTGRVAPRV
jgi:hypothetical protein